MAPKVKAMAKGGARGVLRRPGGREVARPRRPPLRRPAADGEILVPAGRDAWLRGEEMRLKDVSPLEFRLGQRIAVVEGKYFGTMVKVAGTLQKVDLENGEVHLNLQVTGTDNEEILKLVGASSAPFVVHCCPMDCGALETGDRYLHGIKGRLLTSEVRLEEWMKNLEAVPMAPRPEEDELADLRRRGAEMGLGPRGEGLRASGVKDTPAESPQRKKKKKKDPKQKKEGRGRGKIYDGRHPSLAVQKELGPLFSGTGLDPKEKVRRRVLKRAQKYIKKKKSKSSSSSSSSEEEKSSSEDVLETEGINDGLYAETGRAKYISQKFPGALCSEALRMMKESLLTEAGLWDPKTSGDDVLSSRTTTARKCSSMPRTDKSMLQPRPAGQRKGSGCSRRPRSEDQGLRSSDPGITLVHDPKIGDTSSGGRGHSAEVGVASCPSGVVPGQQNSLPVLLEPGSKSRRQSQRKRRERCQRREVRQGSQRQSQRRRRQGQRTRRQESEGCQVRIIGEDDRVNSLVTGERLEVVSTAGGLESGLAVDATAVGASENRYDLPGFLPGVPDQETLNPGQGYRSHDFGTGFLQQDQRAGSSRQSEEKEFSLKFLEGLSFGRLGSLVFGQLLEVLPLRSKSTGGRSNSKLFPLPTSKELLQNTFPSLTLDEVSWLLLVHFALNSVWGGELFCQGPVSVAQRSCIQELIVDVKRVCSLEGSLERFDWDSFFKHRSVDYQGEEVKVAKSFRWCNIAPALPKEVASVPLEDVCTFGAKHYVEHFDQYLKDQEDWPPVSKPRVMVADEDWGEVCAGLVASKVCTFITRDEVFHVAGEPLVNGMFGVSKEEVHEGVEVYRLIMNLIPLNSLCCPITGDVNTLPNWALMNPLVLQPHENLVVSSEDVRCFFYVMRVPSSWTKYLAFNKVVPQDALPARLRGQEVYLAARVLPMGFLNSVSLAQHVHRNLVEGQALYSCKSSMASLS